MDYVHTWHWEFAASLLTECGYKCRFQHGSFANKLNVTNSMTGKQHEFAISQDRIPSERIQPLLNNAPMLGNMRVKREPIQFDFPE